MDYFSGWCHSKRKLAECTAIVTGSNTGIGKETAHDFYLRGARVIMACRDTTKAIQAKEDIEKKCQSNEQNGVLIVEKLDLSSLKSVEEFCDKILASEKEINLLVNNAGVMMCPEGTTVDGLETQMGTNHFGHAFLTLLLLPKIIKSAPARIVFVSSMLHAGGEFDFEDYKFTKTPYKPLLAYSRSKAANVLFAKALAKKLEEHNISNVTTYSLHPGVVHTDLGRHFSDTIVPGMSWFYSHVMSWFMKSAQCGAQTTIYCAVDDACEKQTGLYYSDCQAVPAAKFCEDEQNIQEFWNTTIEVLKTKCVRNLDVHCEK